MNNHIYLDFNASTPLRPRVIATMTEAMQHFGNPSSIHKFGRSARACIESARDVVAAHLDITPSQIVFTSGGTEANNLIIKAHKKTVLMSTIEHKSINRAVTEVIKIPVLPNGTINLEGLENLLSQQNSETTLMSVMLANNETGVIQPIQELARIAHQFDIKMHCDAVAAYTKIPFTYSSLGVDYLTVSSHKIGGPKGCGALIIPLDEQLPALIQGGGQEKGHRAGTENTTGIAGFAQAIHDSAQDNWSIVEAHRDWLEEFILNAYPEVPIYGKESKRLPNISFIGMPGVAAQKQVMTFDLEGFAVSSGSACSSGKVAPSHVLKAMGYGDQQASEATRVSLGWTTTKSEIEDFARAWLTLYERLKMNG
jgi:cysteine desulfurase